MNQLIEIKSFMNLQQEQKIKTRNIHCKIRIRIMNVKERGMYRC